jgi:hypothetical protein
VVVREKVQSVKGVEGDPQRNSDKKWFWIVPVPAYSASVKIGKG